MKASSYLYVIVIVIALSLLAIVTAKHWLPITTDNNSLTRHHYHQLCYLDKGCLFQEDGTSVSLKVSPDSLPVMEALQLDVALTGLKADTVSVELTGRDMPMGMMAVILQKQARWSQYYVGVGSISFCTSDKNMVWLAQVQIKTTTNVYTIDFELQPSR